MIIVDKLGLPVGHGVGVFHDAQWFIRVREMSS